jgi:cephalosporin-C deacetylase
VSQLNSAGTAPPVSHSDRRTAGFAHDLSFDPTHGYTIDDLLAVDAPEPPADFAAFWRGLYEASRQVDVAPRLGPLETVDEAGAIFGVTFTTLGQLRLSGWLVMPNGPIEFGVVVGHGYAGRNMVDFPLPIPNAAVIFPCFRGLGACGHVDGIPDTAMRHVLHGIDSRDRYVLGGCAADLWCAATALLQLVRSIDRPLGYAGTSFGGGIGALALPWDNRFGAAHLSLPSFGHHPLRLTMPCTGSGEAVRHYYTEHPETGNVLRYFDAASAAAHIHIPVQVAAALFDPAVPPPGQFAVHNALAGPRNLVVLSAGHFVHAGTVAEKQTELDAELTFLSAHLT